jgi:hypothetical protein
MGDQSNALDFCLRGCDAIRFGRVETLRYINPHSAGKNKTAL